MKRSFIKKLLIGGLITSICICYCFINVKADANGNIDNIAEEITNYRGDWVPNTSLNEITNPNDINGVFISFNGNIDQEILDGIGYGEYLDIYCDIYNDFLNFGFATTKAYRSTDEHLSYNISFGSIKGIRIANGLSNEDSYFEMYAINSDNTYTLIYSYQGIDGYSYSNYWNTSQIKAFNFPFREDNMTITYRFNTNMTDFGYLENAWNFMLYFFKTSFIMLMPSAYIELINENYLQEIEYIKVEYYDRGYEAGISEQTPYRFTFLTGIFNGVNDLLAIEIFPDIQLGYFVFVPLALGITGMIFWFWRKD